jgi:hypothetical protein
MAPFTLSDSTRLNSVPVAWAMKKSVATSTPVPTATLMQMGQCPLGSVYFSGLNRTYA